MKLQVKDITERLGRDFPGSMAMEWDNPGLQVGRSDAMVRRIAVALDATDAVVEQCVQKKAELLLTHHPLLLSGIRQINDGSMAGRRILTMAEHGIAHFAMHTNYDTARMGALAAGRLALRDCAVLEVTGTGENEAYGIGAVGALESPMTAGGFCAFARQVFGLDGIRLFGDPGSTVKRIAVSPGSGKSMIGAALRQKADLLITGDIGHHDGLDAADQGLLVADAGHYGLEHIFIRDICEWLGREFPQAEVMALQPEAPFVVL